METALVRIRKDQHEKLSGFKSDTGGDITISSAVQEAVDLHLRRRKLNALVMKAYRCKNMENARLVLDDIAEFLNLPKDYLLTD